MEHDAVTFTLDLEDHRPSPDHPVRYPALTREVLEFLDLRGIRGTFFVVGEVAEAAPDLVGEVAARGHEIGLHGWRHTPLTELDADSFRADVDRGKALLEDLAGRPVVGFRAPTFSLVPESRWAIDVLADAGFAYSSSILPARSPLFGDPSLPTTPFRWPNGLAELPVPIAGAGPARVPYLGGTYLRVLPAPLIRRAHARGERRVPWTYLHPYDVDTDEPYWKVPDAGWMSPLLWVGRKRVLGKLDQLVGTGAGRPLRERLDEARRGGTFHPGEPAAADREREDREDGR